MKTGVLTALAAQYVTRHGHLPDSIVVTPLAALALSIKGSLATYCGGIPVRCREIDENEAALENGRSLAVFLAPEGRHGRLLSCDLKV